MKKVGVVGLGYVGFPLACAISKSGKYKTIGLEIDQSKIDNINNKISPIEDEQAALDIAQYPFTASNDFSLLSDIDIVIVCVPTPIFDDHSPNMKPLLGSITTISQHMKPGCDIIIESTINPGVCDEKIVPHLDTLGKSLNKDYFLSHCPERINPGDQKRNVYNINRNVGGSTPETTARIAEFYRSFLSAEVYEMKDIKHAEATKIVENIFRDINIAFVNELAKSFDSLGLDVVEVIKGSSNKPFAFMAHYPGCGVGGHCIPVDPYYMIERAKQQGFDHKFLSLAREINNSMPEYTIELLIKKLNEIKKSLNGSNIGLLGMSYKKDLGDMRESPAFEIKTILEKYGAIVHIYEPFDKTLSTHQSLEDILDDVEAIVIATNHTEFTEQLTGKTLNKHNIKIVVDGRNCLDKIDLLSEGILYTGIGR